MTERLREGAIDTVVIGAGQAGLAMSKRLSEHRVDHVVLERYEIAHSWKHERWDSLRLLTPNWMTRLPGLDDAERPDEFDPADAVGSRLEQYARTIEAPVAEHTEVLSVRSNGAGGFVVSTDRGTWSTRSVVVASGACVVAATPPFADSVPSHVEQIDSLSYRRPSQLPPGKAVVVGASASGVQLADEIARSGREVVLCAGEHRRMVRRHRGMDIFWWMETIGMLDEATPDAEPGRIPPSMQLVGTPENHTLDLNSLQDLGVQITGRMSGIEGQTALVDASLAEYCAASDAALYATLAAIDRYVDEHGLAADFDAAEPVAPTHVPAPITSIDLTDVGSIVWATGFAPHFPYLDPAWVDERGAIVHRGGIASTAGLYVIGLPFTRRRNSNFINGVGGDALALADHLHRFLSETGSDPTARHQPLA